MKTLFDNVLTVLCQNSAEALLPLRLCLGINKIAKALLHSGLVSTNSYFPYNRSIARNSALSGQSQSPIVTPFLEIGATVRKQQNTRTITLCYFSDFFNVIFVISYLLGKVAFIGNVFHIKTRSPLTFLLLRLPLTWN